MASNGEEELHRFEIEIEWTNDLFYPVLAAPMTYPVYQTGTEHSKCAMTVFVQGDPENLKGKITFLTVHDVGSSHRSMVGFANSLKKEIPQIGDKVVFVHVCLPGQEPGSKNFVSRYSVDTISPGGHQDHSSTFEEGEYPTMEQLGKSLGYVLAKFGLVNCFGIGEGAGADILCRFAMEYPERVPGLVLINPSSTVHGIIGNIKELFASLPLESSHMTNSNWNYLLVHKFGNHHRDSRQLRYIQDVTDEGINPQNLSRFLYSFSKRSDFTGDLKEKLGSIDIILVTGGKAPHNGNVLHMFENLNSNRRGLMEAEHVEDVLTEAPDYVAYALITVCHRHKLLLDIPPFAKAQVK